MDNNFLDKTINQLEGNKDLSSPNFGSYPVQKVYELMDKKLRFFTPEDLRIMIGQNIGLEYTIPLAIKVLCENPLLEANFYEGDLLLKVLKADDSFWNENPRYKKQVIELFLNEKVDYSILDSETQKEVYEAYERLND